MGERKEFNLDEISLFSILRDVVKNCWVILLAAVTAWFAVTGAEGLLYVPEYTATATLAVSARGNNSNAYSSLTLTNQMAGIFSEVFDSNVLREKIAEDLGQESIEGEISSSIIEETNLITLQVTSVNPRQAYLIIQSAIENYDTVSDYLFSNAVLRIVQEPTVPVSPSNVLNLSRLRRLGMLGAAALTGCLIVLVSVLRFTVKTKDSARRNLDGRVLETIPYENKNKTLKGLFRRGNKSILITSTLVSAGYVEAVRKLATHLDHRMRRKKQKVIMVSSVAENEGKSSTAANLAIALAEKGKKVMLIDTDLKKPAQYKIFGRPGNTQSSLTDYLEGKVPLNKVMFYEKQFGIYRVFQKSGVHNSVKYLDSDYMRKLISSGRKVIDYLILDSSPMSLASDTELLMKMTDTVLMVVRQDWTDIRAVNDTVDNIRQSGADFSGFVLNAFHREQLFQRSHEYRYYGYRSSRRMEGED
ncbi:MAG: polysaccharide biosynthesis tyrosine autokinase [Ruminococcus sp.]|jgi:capsular exopolysaccharide synthesis family protein